MLYQWEKFCKERLRALLHDKRIYYSNPASFNGLWDCKPHFNKEVLNDPIEGLVSEFAKTTDLEP